MRKEDTQSFGHDRVTMALSRGTLWSRQSEVKILGVWGRKPPGGVNLGGSPGTLAHKNELPKGHLPTKKRVRTLALGALLWPSLLGLPQFLFVS